MHIAPGQASEKFLRAVTKVGGSDHLSLADLDRLSYSRDLNPVSNLATNEGRFGPMPDAVVWPADTQQVAQIVKLAAEHRTPLIPFGAGSGVCGGTVPLRGGIILDLKRMNNIIKLDEDSLAVTAGAGIIGQHLEMELNRKGYTMGHFPSSVYSSTLGGYLAARSAGQLSAKYGKIEDMILGLEAVLGTGEILRTTATPRASLGPDWNQVLIGSEGTLAIITEATCRIRPYPAERRFTSFVFPGPSEGTEAIRQIMRHELRPAAIRLYDELDTVLVGTSSKNEESSESFWNAIPLSQFGNFVKSVAPGLIRRTERFFGKRADLINLLEKFATKGCLLVMTFEGESDLVADEEALAVELCEKLGGVNHGPEAALRWWNNRYHVSYKQSKVFYHGAIVDTIEMATTWDKLVPLYEEVRQAVRDMAFIMAHFSHAYLDGASVYFTFVTAAPNVEKAEQAHRAVWDAAATACQRIGAAISHHHGIGYTKARFMSEEHGPMMRVYEALKREMDPAGILNPGKMGL